jgi:outer membrane protein OmpA-like peptidoglycan-associated protein
MNTKLHSHKPLIATAVAAALLAACASAPLKPAGSAEVRNKLTQLQSDTNLASRAPVAIKEAETAVRIAETPQPDVALAAHNVLMADRKVDTAKAQAETRFAEDQRPALSAGRETARLDARTREADAAKNQVAIARAQSADAQLTADAARRDADIAQAATLTSQQEARELQQQIEQLQAKVTERGLVLTLGDVLFTSGKAELRSGTAGNLDKLTNFLNQYPARTVIIEGYTDSVGTSEYNEGLSQRRADAVKTYLVEQGVGAMRLTALGKGESDPVGENESAAGRQQNRRVEVIISNPPAASR